MSKGKFADSRYRIINRELSRGRCSRRVSTKQLQLIMRNELSREFAIRTIQKDLDHMQDTEVGFSAPICYDTSAKKYYYSDPTFSIAAFKLKPEEIQSLKFLTQSLRRYKGTGLVELLESAIEKIIHAVRVEEAEGLVNIQERVQPEHPLAARRVEYIPDLTEALERNIIITFTYHKFTHEAPTYRRLAPYLLKEYKSRWYIIGEDLDKQAIRTFALDRMSELTLSENIFSLDHIDFQTYYKHSFGITVTDDDPIEIVIAFDNSSRQYAKSTPLHLTQKILVDSASEFQVSITVIPTYEFYAELLSWGPGATVLSPEHIRTAVKSKIEAMIQKYC